MGKVIAVWGQHGSGKTTIAANLAYMLARDYVVGLVSTQVDYPSVQLSFGMSIDEDKSLKDIYMATTDDYECKKHFAECPVRKNLFVLAVPDKTDYLMFADENVQPDKDKADTMIKELRDAFDYLIVDCDCDINNALTDFSLIYADTVIYTIRASVQGIAFCKAYEQFLDDLKVSASSRIHVLNMDKNYVSPAQFEGVIGGKIDVALPWDLQVEKAENTGFPVLMNYQESGGLGRKLMADSYKTCFNKLINLVLQWGKGVNEDGKL